VKAATSIPSVDIWALFKEWGGLALLAPLAGWATAEVRSWRKRRVRRQELAESLAEAVTLQLDLERFRFEYAPDRVELEDYLDGPARERWEERGGVGQSPREQYESLKVRNRDSRSRTWQAQGFPEAPQGVGSYMREQHAERVRVLREMKATKRWKAAESQPTKPGGGA